MERIGPSCEAIAQISLGREDGRCPVSPGDEASLAHGLHNELLVGRLEKATHVNVQQFLGIRAGVLEPRGRKVCCMAGEAR